MSCLFRFLSLLTCRDLVLPQPLMRVPRVHNQHTHARTDPMHPSLGLRAIGLGPRVSLALSPVTIPAPRKFVGTRLSGTSEVR